MKRPWFDDSATGVTMSKRCVDLVTRIFKKCRSVHRGYEIDGQPSPCYEWQGANSGNGRGGGYGRIKVDSQMAAVHRVIWSCFNGYLGSKREIDHLCRNRICCNPNHLEAVTSKENQRRKNIVYAEIAEGER